MEIADRNMVPRHCRYVCGKKITVRYFSFLPLKNVKTFYPESILPEIFVSIKKEKKVSTDNSLESSSLSCPQN